LPSFFLCAFCLKEKSVKQALIAIFYRTGGTSVQKRLRCRGRLRVKN
jgi:hypothetical protein